MQLFLSVYVDDITMAGQTLNDAGTLAKVDLEGPTSLLDHMYLGCTERASQVHNRIVMAKQKLFSKVVSTNTEDKTEEKSKRHHSLELRHGLSRSQVC